MAPKADVQVARRKQILDAAEVVFARLGFSQARMDDIVEESGLSKGTLYWYYKSKDAIIQALMDRLFVGDIRAAEALVHADGTAGERLAVFMRSSMREISNFRHLMPLGYEFVALAARRKSVRKVIAGYYQRYRRLLREIFQQGVEAGEFADMDPDDAALAIMAVEEGLTLLWFTAPAEVDFDRLGDMPMRVLLDGFRKREM